MLWLILSKLGTGIKPSEMLDSYRVSGNRWLRKEKEGILLSQMGEKLLHEPHHKAVENPHMKEPQGTWHHETCIHKPAGGLMAAWQQDIAGACYDVWSSLESLPTSSVSCSVVQTMQSTLQRCKSKSLCPPCANLCSFPFPESGFHPCWYSRESHEASS